ncbi:hypothetical protein [Glaciihabitans sp. UYNi722]|uniref:hypothetical protein n=1 Tax=Glaciihabitans sp. UYNi722 TaxID=3156344 RepID=UPI003399606A
MGCPLKTILSGHWRLGDTSRYIVETDSWQAITFEGESIIRQPLTIGQASTAYEGADSGVLGKVGIVWSETS